MSAGEVYDEVMGHYEIINEVSVHPFMDTQGLYVRVEYYNDVDYENGGDCGLIVKSKIYTYLFAGDALQFVKSWEDSRWRLEYDRIDHLDGEEREIHYDFFKYSMSYDGINWTSATAEEKNDTMSKEYDE